MIHYGNEIELRSKGRRRCLSQSSESQKSSLVITYFVLFLAIFLCEARAVASLSTKMTALRGRDHSLACGEDLRAMACKRDPIIAAAGMRFVRPSSLAASARNKTNRGRRSQGDRKCGWIRYQRGRV